MNDTPLRITQDGPVRWLHLSRPERRNALDDSLTNALAEQVATIDDDPVTSVVVIAGDGPSFCAGGDFRHFLSHEDHRGVVRFLTGLSDCLTRIETSAKPWVAALHGHAIAGGLELALVCDVVVAAEGTLIGDGHLNQRLLPAAGSSVRLERALGKSMARWLHLSGDAVRAEALERTGWLHAVVPPGSLDQAAKEIADHLASRHSGAQQNFKRLLNDIAGMESQEALDRELDAFGRNWEESDVASALHAFLDRRTKGTS